MEEVAYQKTHGTKTHIKKHMATLQLKTYDLRTWNRVTTPQPLS